MARVDFFRTIRGVEIQVFATDFTRGPGLPYGPEQVWAETMDGEDFELTDTEVEELGIEATSIALDWSLPDDCH